MSVMFSSNVASLFIATSAAMPCGTATAGSTSARTPCFATASAAWRAARTMFALSGRRSPHARRSRRSPPRCRPALGFIVWPPCTIGRGADRTQQLFDAGAGSDRDDGDACRLPPRQTAWPARASASICACMSSAFSCDTAPSVRAHANTASGSAACTCTRSISPPPTTRTLVAHRHHACRMRIAVEAGAADDELRAVADALRRRADAASPRATHRRSARRRWTGSARSPRRPATMPASSTYSPCAPESTTPASFSTGSRFGLFATASLRRIACRRQRLLCCRAAGCRRSGAPRCLGDRREDRPFLRHRDEAIRRRRARGRAPRRARGIELRRRRASLRSRRGSATG